MFQSDRLQGFRTALQVPRKGLLRKALCAVVEDGRAQEADSLRVGHHSVELDVLQLLEECWSVLARVDGTRERHNPLGVFLA